MSARISAAVVHDFLRWLEGRAGWANISGGQESMQISIEGLRALLFGYLVSVKGEALRDVLKPAVLEAFALCANVTLDAAAHADHPSKYSRAAVKTRRAAKRLWEVLLR